jgi:ribonuclease R
VICSHARFTYTEVAAILANTAGPRRPSGSELVPHLLNLHEVYRALLKERAKRGAIDFETTETQIVCDDNGRIEKIVPRTRNEAHRLIEEAMLAANVCSADFVAQAKHPALYRVHEGPTPEKKVTLQNYLKALGLGMTVSDDPKPREFQAIADATKDRPTRCRSTPCCCVRCSRRSTQPPTAATSGWPTTPTRTSTSPIRRYPDLLVHRVIKAILHHKRYHIDTAALEDAPQRARAASRPKRDAAEREQLGGAGAHCSANERRADEASRDVEAWLKCRYMREHLGEEFGGTVTRSRASACSCTLDALYVEGWCTSPSSAASTTASTRSGRSCAASAPECATSSGARCGAGQPRRPRRPQDRLPHGARRRRRRRADPRAPRPASSSKSNSAVAELGGR